jgi:hypothetical protein
MRPSYTNNNPQLEEESVHEDYVERLVRVIDMATRWALRDDPTLTPSPLVSLSHIAFISRPST